MSENARVGHGWWSLYSSSLFLVPSEWASVFLSYKDQLCMFPQHSMAQYQSLNDCWTILHEHHNTQRVLLLLPLTSRLFSNDTMSLREFMSRFEKTLDVQHVLFILVDHEQASNLTKLHHPKKTLAFPKHKVSLASNLSRASFIMHIRNASATEADQCLRILGRILSSTLVCMPSHCHHTQPSLPTRTQFLSPNAPYISVRYLLDALTHALQRLPNPPLAPKIFQLHDTPQSDLLLENWKFSPFIYGDPITKQLSNACVEHTSSLSYLQQITVLSSNPTPHVLLYGLIGSGKQTLCSIFTHSKPARVHFAQRGGIFSLKLPPLTNNHTTQGKNSLELNNNIFSALKYLIKLILNHVSVSKTSPASSDLLLSLDPFCTTVHEAKQQLTSYFSSLDESTSTLLIIHGITSIHQLFAFYFPPHECPNLKIIFTTDNFALAETVTGAHNLTLSVMCMKPLSAQCALQLLSVKTGVIQSKLPQELCAEIAELTTYSPLALNILACMLRDRLELNKNGQINTNALESDWMNAVKHCRSSAVPGLKKYVTLHFLYLHSSGNKPSSMDQQIPQDNIVPLYETSLKTIAFSAKQLEDEAQYIYEAFQHLVVFKEGEKVPLLIIRLLWEQIGIVEQKKFWNVLYVLTSKQLIHLHVFHKKSGSGSMENSNVSVEWTGGELGDESGDARKESLFVSLHSLVSHYLHMMCEERSKEIRKIDPSARSDCDLVSKHMNLLSAFARVSTGQQ